MVFLPLEIPVKVLYAFFIDDARCMSPHLLDFIIMEFLRTIYGRVLPLNLWNWFSVVSKDRKQSKVIFRNAGRVSNAVQTGNFSNLSVALIRQGESLSSQMLSNLVQSVPKLLSALD